MTSGFFVMSQLFPAVSQGSFPSAAASACKAKTLGLKNPLSCSWRVVEISGDIVGFCPDIAGTHLNDLHFGSSVHAMIEDLQNRRSFGSSFAPESLGGYGAIQHGSCAVVKGQELEYFPNSIVIPQ